MGWVPATRSARPLAPACSLVCRWSKRYAVVTRRVQSWRRGSRAARRCPAPMKWTRYLRALLLSTVSSSLDRPSARPGWRLRPPLVGDRRPHRRNVIVARDLLDLGRVLDDIALGVEVIGEQ